MTNTLASCMNVQPGRGVMSCCMPACGSCANAVVPISPASTIAATARGPMPGPTFPCPICGAVRLAPRAPKSCHDDVMYDVVIVGAGPAGLSAALMLGRCRRRVLVCDTGRPRNYASRALHGYLTRDGIDPREFRSMGRDELRQYETVELRDVAATDAQCEANGQFRVTLADGSLVRARKLLVATGVCDNLPDVRGIQEFYGRSVFHCP